MPQAIRCFSAPSTDKAATTQEAAAAATPLGLPYTSMSIGVPKETFPLERRVSQTPESVAKLVKEGFSVNVESGAGVASNFSDAMYVEAGASISDTAGAWASDIVTHVSASASDNLLLSALRNGVSTSCTPYNA